MEVHTETLIKFSGARVGHVLFGHPEELLARPGPASPRTLRPNGRLERSQEGQVVP